jgi:hypothetical protein
MANQKPTDLEAFRYTLPYSSQMFGVYQPILGLKSRRAMARVDRASHAAAKHVVRALAARSGRQQPPAWLASQAASQAHQATAHLQQQSGRAPSAAELKDIAHMAGAHVAGGHAQPQHAHGGAFGSPHHAPPSKQALHEAAVATTMQHLAQHAPSALQTALHGAAFSPRGPALLPYTAPLSHFDAQSQAAVLSPIGLIQLYRQYFFEFESFLGPPVGHVWVSPGGSLEVYEVHSRKLTQSQETERTNQSTTKSESESKDQDDLSTAIAQDNTHNTNLAVSAQAGVNFGVFHASASSSLSLGNTQHDSQQTAHKQTRAQSEKVAKEMRSSFKTTFKTSLEQADMQSRRYVLANTTEKLMNYELRRKMRKVGVQVQHVGTNLCWQVFVDHPGAELGIASLLHVAQPADLSSLQPPEAPPVLMPKETSHQVTIHFKGKGDNDDTGDDYVGGVGSDIIHGTYSIVATTTFKLAPPAAGYTLEQVVMDTFTPSNPSSKDAYVQPSFKIHKLPKKPHDAHGKAHDTDTEAHEASFDVHLDRVNFDDAPSLILSLNLLWTPPAPTKAEKDAYAKKMAEFTWREQQMVHAAYVNAVRDRVKVMGQVARRPEDDLRDEERCIVYRNLLRQLIDAPHEPGSNVDISHVTSELIRSIFDVDNMLYFVAPDWWKPQAQRGRPAPASSAAGHHPAAPAHHGGGHEVPPEAEPQHLTSDDAVGWDGKRGHGRPNNYLITEDSAPAPYGASLGWLLQLDGDERRNAFLNAPWVKAVIPIRAGKEEAALEWLTKEHVEGTDGLDAQYVPAPRDDKDLKGKTIGEAIRMLAQKLAEHNTDMDNTLEAQTVFEKGFDPLDKGFRATGAWNEVFDQWIEVLPTDQVVALEYTPPTS